MIKELGKTYLITTNEWFTAPDGHSYKAVFGTVEAILDDDKSLGIKTNRHSSNWFIEIGNMIIAGCQIHYCIKTNHVSYNPPVRDVVDGMVMKGLPEAMTRIYDADAKFIPVGL